MDAYSYKLDERVPDFPDDRPVVIFDGHCGFCTGWAKLLLKYDRNKTFRMSTAQSPLGKALYVHYGLDPEDYESNVLLQDGLAWFKSEGSIMMAEQLGFPWKLAKVFRVLPLPLRDRMYEFVARHRFKIWGRRQVCYLPSAEDKDRFLS